MKRVLQVIQRAIKRTFITSLYIILSQFAIRHPFQLALLLVGIIAAYLTTSNLRPYFQAIDIGLHVGIFYQEDGNEVDKVRLNIERKGDIDFLRLDLFLTKDATGNLSIELPEEFNEHRGGFTRNVEFRSSAPRWGSMWYYYTLKNTSAGATVFSQEFSGRIFSRSAREQEIRITTRFLPRKEVPVELSLTGIRGLTISNLAPKPRFESDYALIFDFIPGPRSQTGRDWSEVTMNATDRLASYRRDFVLLVGGIWIGILSSFIVTIFLNFVIFSERAYKRMT